MRPEDWLRLLMEQFMGNRGFGSVADYSTPRPFNAYQGPQVGVPPSFGAHRAEMALGMNGGTPDGSLPFNRGAGAMPLSRA